MASAEQETNDQGVFYIITHTFNSFYCNQVTRLLRSRSGCEVITEVIRESCDLLPVSEPGSVNEAFRHRRGNNVKSSSNNNSKIGIKHAGDDLLNILHALSLVLRLLPACIWV